MRKFQDHINTFTAAFAIILSNNIEHGGRLIALIYCSSFVFLTSAGKKHSSHFHYHLFLLC